MPYRTPHTLITAAALADSLGVDRSTLRRWQRLGWVPGPDLRLPGGRLAYSEQRADEVLAAAQPQPITDEVRP